MPEFCHLHCHTQYSLLDGASDIGVMMDKAVRDGQKGVALTDHGNMFGAFKFVAEANKRGIKPIVGCEFYMVENRHKQAFSRAKGEKDVRYHQLMLAKNQVGYHNLVKLCSLGYIEGKYGKFPRIDKKLILDYNEGIIATSCCIGAEVPQLILQKKHAEAEAALKWWLDIFGEDYYIEIQRHRGLENIDQSGVSQEDINQHLLRLAKKYNVKVICTNDSHYVEQEDSDIHDILLCVNTGNLLEETKRFKFPSNEFYFKTQAEMGKLFQDVPVSLDNTMEILDKIEPLQLARDVLLPAFPIPKGFETQDDFLRHLTYVGAKKRYGTITPEISERLDFELDTIRKTGYPGYFLIVQDFTTTAREIGVAVGPGRGCLTGDAKIVLKNGSTKDLKDITLGDEVYTIDGSSQKVLNKFEYNVKEELLKIKNYFGEFSGITLTKDHKVYAEKQKRPKNYSTWAESTKKSRKMPEPTGELKWIPAKEIEVGDWLFVPKPQVITKETKRFDLGEFSNDHELHHEEDYAYHDVLNVLCNVVANRKKVKRFIRLDADWYKIFGLFVGDGWIRKDGRPCISIVFYKEHTASLNFVVNKMEEHGFEVSLHYVKNTVQVHVNNKQLYLLFKKLFKDYRFNSHTKYIPEFIMNASEENIGHFLRGYNWADGHEGQYKYRFTTTSRRLADQVRFLCLRLGIPSSLGLDKREGDKRETFKNTRKSYYVTIPKDSRIGAVQAEKNYFYKPLENGFLVKVRSVETVQGIEKVYDFEVEKHHNYLTSSCLVHNSAAGSAVSYCIGITNVDPIKYDLLFERFLNPERVSMPDIDIDFDDEGRQRVIDYVVEKYGQKQVAQIITYGSMKAKSALRDVGRVMNIPLQEVSVVAKTFPEHLNASLVKVLAEGDVDKKLKGQMNPDDMQKAHEFRKLAEGNLPVAQMIRAAKKLEGSVRNTGVHACGVVITPDDVTKYVPVSMAKDNDLYISQFDNSVAEDAGLLKMDFLGLKTLTIIKDAVQMIEENHGVKLDIDEVPLDDLKTYELFQRGETVGIFQYESAGMQKYMKELKPTAFNDLIAMNALYRPGPLEYIPNFINRKHGREEIVYDLDAMEEYLHETYGICVTGDTLVFNPKTGKRTRLDEITDHSETFEVQGVDADLNTKFAKVSYWVCNGKKEVLEVKLRNGSKVRLTPDHRVLTENGWQEIGDLQVGDSIATPRKLEVIEGKEYDKTALKVLAEQQIIPEFVFSLKEELIAFFVGELWGNGDFSDTSKIAYATDSEKFAFDLQALLLRLGIAANVNDCTVYAVNEFAGTENRYEVVVADFNRVQQYLSKVSEYNRSVSSVSVCRNNENIKTKVHSTDPNGDGTTYLDKSSKTIQSTNRVGATLLKTTSNLLKKQSIGAFVKNKSKNGDKVQGTDPNDNSFDIHWQEITSIEAVGKELVYDITVEDIHNFVGNNIILHNCVYQEQVMLLSQKLANFSKGEADVLRKAMGKKKKNVLDKMYPQFLEGGAANGHPKKILDKVWKDWEAFASYAFNKSHSTCYALVAFQTAYLKANYPAEFMAGVLSHNMKDIKKLNFFLSECNRMGIKCMLPDVNESNVKFAVNKKGEIRFAMAAVKGVGAAAVEDLIGERKKGGAFKDIFDIVKRVNLRTVNKKAFENLALAGGFDSFGIHRAQYFDLKLGEEVNLIERILKYGNTYQKQQVSTAQLDLFGAGLNAPPINPEIPDCEPWPLLERLEKEREVTGIFLSGHPLDNFKREVNLLKYNSIEDITKYPDRELTIACIVMAAERRKTKTGSDFGKFIIEDFNTSYEVVLFGKDYIDNQKPFQKGHALQIKGRYVSRKWGSGKEFKLSEEPILLESVLQERLENITLSIPFRKINNSVITQIENICNKYSGNLSLNIHLTDDEKILEPVELYSQKLKINISADALDKVKNIRGIHFLGEKIIKKNNLKMFFL